MISNLANAKLVLDKIEGQGSFAVNMKPSTPFVTGEMNLNGLDLSPYMAAYSTQKPAGEIQPWSTAPINTAPLRAVDGDFKFTTPNVKTDRITMGANRYNGKITRRRPDREYAQYRALWRLGKNDNDAGWLRFRNQI